MQTIFEIFLCSTGMTQGYRHGERKALETCERCGGDFDYLPAREEGFYVVNTGDFVKGGPYMTRDAAARSCDMMNMASDRDTFSVVQHTL